MDHFTDEKAVGVSKVLVIEATIGPFSSVLARAASHSGPAPNLPIFASRVALVCPRAVADRRAAPRPAERRSASPRGVREPRRAARRRWLCRHRPNLAPLRPSARAICHEGSGPGAWLAWRRPLHGLA